MHVCNVVMYGYICTNVLHVYLPAKGLSSEAMMINSSFGIKLGT